MLWLESLKIAFILILNQKNKKAQWVVIITLIRIYLLHAYLILQTLGV